MLAKFTSAVGSTLLVLGLEWGVVSWQGQRQLTSSWELKHGTLCLIPSALLYTLPIAVVAALGWALLERVRGSRPARWALVIACGSLAGLAAFSVSHGRHFADAARRSGFVVVVALAGALLTAALAPVVARALQRSPSVVSAIVFIVGLLLELINHFVLVRLYPGFHVALAVSVLLLAPGLRYGLNALIGVTAPWRHRILRALPTLGLVLIYGACAVLLGAAARGLAPLDNFRLMLSEQAPILGEVVELNADWFPTALSSNPSCVTGDCLDRPPSGASQLDLTGRDILLITIDALRADHVGSYGYARKTTPFIDTLAASAVQFEQAYCPTPHTSYSITSLLTGKYMRPLLLQGLGEDSQTLANILRTYGYKTAAFYPPAVFFIDNERFKRFESSGLGFEYRKVEFSEGEDRSRQVRDYLKSTDKGQPLFLWVHLFGPHEPYELHPEHDFGSRDMDRYDSEIAAADATVGEIVGDFRQRSPSAAVIVSADHGEEFGDHGGHYHGSSVYEEQVRVPLIVSIPGVVEHRQVQSPVQTIDLFPTLLGALKIPVSPRVRGRDLSALLTQPQPVDGFAFAETDEMTLIAERQLRLVCQRKLGACKLFDLALDPTEQQDASVRYAEVAGRMRAELRRINATQGEFERQGQGQDRASKGWPAAILRGISGDVDAADDLVPLLDDADVEVRRKAAELLFRLKARSAVAGLRLALGRDEDSVVQRYVALALTRVGERAPLTFDLLRADDREWRRPAALALAENGDGRGQDELVAWWVEGGARDFETAKDLLSAFATLRCRDAVAPLTTVLGDVRLTPYVARTLSAIGDPAARGALLRAFQSERYQGTRSVLAEALVHLGAKSELIEPMRLFLGVPDPLTNGVELALRAGILDRLGGPSEAVLKRLAAGSTPGEVIDVLVPPGGNDRGIRILVRAKNSTSTLKKARFWVLQDQRNHIKSKYLNIDNLTKNSQPLLSIEIPPNANASETSATAPDSMGLRSGQSAELVVISEPGLEIEGIAVLPLCDELPPPAPKPWKPDAPHGVEGQ